MFPLLQKKLGLKLIAKLRKNKLERILRSFDIKLVKKVFLWPDNEVPAQGRGFGKLEDIQSILERYLAFWAGFLKIRAGHHHRYEPQKFCIYKFCSVTKDIQGNYKSILMSYCEGYIEENSDGVRYFNVFDKIPIHKVYSDML